MEDIHPRKPFYTKYPKHSSQLSVDSPLYDASEEDNTDDGSSVGTPTSRQGTSGIPSATIQTRSRTKPGASSRLAHSLAVEVDSGVDSPTYDGDVETATASTTGSRATNQHSYSGSLTSVASSMTADTNEYPLSPVSSTYPDPPSSSAVSSTLSNAGDSSDEFSSLEQSNTLADAPRRGTINAASAVSPVFLVPALPRGTPRAPDIGLPNTTPDTTAPVDVTQDADTSEEKVNTSALSADDIRAFVNAAIEGQSHRPYKINSPPQGRPIRIYADGVYDMFHFGHALQLRQAKLSFPSVHLLVGVCSDELCQTHKARTVLSHSERLESARQCRWVDEVVPEAPWVITPEFLETHQIDYVAHDEDPYAGAEGAEDIYQPIKDLGKFLPTRRTPGISTSELLERLVLRYRHGDFDGKLEKLGHGELSARGSQYDDSRPASRMGRTQS